MQRQYNNRIPAIRNGNSGFAIVTAIFLLVILAALGAFMVSLSGVQHSTASLSASSSRVYYGAKSGLEWGIQRTVAPALGAGVCSPSSSFALNGAGLNGVNVTVTCSLSSYTIGGNTHNIYTLTSTATFGVLGSADYAERKLSASVCRSDNPNAARC